MSISKTHPKTIQAAMKMVAASTEEILKDWSPEQIKDRVRGMLDKRAEEVVAKLLGFKNALPRDCGRWEVDHCNGRSGNSAAGDFLRKEAGTAVNEWLKKHAGSLPDLPRGANRSLKREYLDAYRRELTAQLRELAQEKAAADAHNILRIFSKDLGL